MLDKHVLWGLKSPLGRFSVVVVVVVVAVVAEGKSLEFTIDLCIESERGEIVVLSGHESEEL